MLAEATNAISACTTSAALEELRVAWLGKSGKITEQLKMLGKLPPEERKAKGAELNQIKEQIAAALEEKKSVLETAELNASLTTDVLDVTLPTRAQAAGRLHPISRVIDEVTEIFASLGFAVAEGPDIEDDRHNFTALNIPESHPARQMHDTFYLPSGKVLRTHTSPVQIRVMSSRKPPYRFLAPGSTFRSDSDQTHTPMFHQIEGFAIDKDITFGHLKWVIEEFLKAFFELPSVPLRFRPSFFPFTEPSAEVDIGCKRTKDELIIGGGEDWLEIMGCGMVHPNVLKNCGIDANEWQGFAFGMGVERLAMLKYGIPDLRTFFESDVRWLQHYGFAS